MKKYLCLVCGVEFESDDENPVCPVCGARQIYKKLKKKTN